MSGAGGCGRRFTVYGRAGCHLCEQMLAALRPWQRRYGFEIEVVDIDADPQLFDRYNTRVPVLAEGAVEICYYFLDEPLLERHLARPSPPGG